MTPSLRNSRLNHVPETRRWFIGFPRCGSLSRRSRSGPRPAQNMQHRKSRCASSSAVRWPSETLSGSTRWRSLRFIRPRLSPIPLATASLALYKPVWHSSALLDFKNCHATASVALCNCDLLFPIRASNHARQFRCVRDPQRHGGQNKTAMQYPGGRRSTARWLTAGGRSRSRRLQIIGSVITLLRIFLRNFGRVVERHNLKAHFAVHEHDIDR